MRSSYLSSLVFALLASTAFSVNAAPAAQTPPAASMSAPAPAEHMGKVNINSASAETLQKELSGIGAGKAAAIVAYRDESGAFTSVDELIEVKGIGKSLLDKNRDRLTIE